jgi:hypothetical protein
MKVEQFQWTEKKGWQPALQNVSLNKAQLVFLFGSTALLKSKKDLNVIRDAYPQAQLVGCSTAGEIYGTSVNDGSISLTAVQFDKTSIKTVTIKVKHVEESYVVGQTLAAGFPQENLVHVFVLSDGLNVNGSDLVKGIVSALPGHVAVTGGLSGDGSNFKETVIVHNDLVGSNLVTAVGFYGNNLKVGYGSLGGWDPFGPERIVTKSKANILYELDGQSALELYKKYLGEHAKGLPSTGLLYPLSLKVKDSQNVVVRTILSVNEADQSMTFAGDVPEGGHVRLMKANFDRLIDGATGAAKNSRASMADIRPELAVLISCVGRKLILNQRIEEEVEGVRDVLGKDAVMTGFYSYGEISPFTQNAKCELHNQTMTITVFSEQ